MFSTAKQKIHVKKPGDIERLQIDYILVRKRYRNGVKGANSLPGADCNSDHNMVAMRMAMRLKVMRKGRKRLKWDMVNLKKSEKEFSEYVEQRIQKGEYDDIEGSWNNLKSLVAQAGKNVAGYQKWAYAKKPWVTKEMMDKMEERRYYKM